MVTRLYCERLEIDERRVSFVSIIGLELLWKSCLAITLAGSFEMGDGCLKGNNLFEGLSMMGLRCAGRFLK